VADAALQRSAQSPKLLFNSALLALRKCRTACRRLASRL